MKGRTLALESYWDTGLTHKVPGCITQTKKTRGKRKQGKPGWEGLREEAMQDGRMRALQARGRA